MSLSNRKVYTKSLYLIENSTRNVSISSESHYKKSISNRKVYTKYLYLIEKSISNRKVYI